jgi:hypothetical protein
MARIRSIKPDFFLDEDLCKLPLQTRLFYIGLWCQADKAGRLEDRPEKLKVVIMPYDRCNVESILNALASIKLNSGLPFIVRYRLDDGKRYIQVLKWEHQRPHHTEHESKIPPPPSELIKELTDHAPLSNGEKPLGREGKGVKGPASNATPLPDPVDKSVDKSKAKAGFAQARDGLPTALIEDCISRFGIKAVDQAMSEFKTTTTKIRDPVPWFREACANIAHRANRDRAESDWAKEKASFKEDVEREAIAE